MATPFYPFEVRPPAVPPIAWKREWPIINFNPVLSKNGQAVVETLNRWNPKVSPIIITELLRLAHLAGYVGDDEYYIPSDGSPVGHVCKVADPKLVRLVDLLNLRTSPRHRLEPSHWMTVTNFFLGSITDILSEFTADDLAECKYGVFRIESLYSLPDLQQVNYEEFLKLLAINLRERKQVFGPNFKFVSKSGGIPIDDDLERQIYEPYGPHRKLGDVTFRNREHHVFLRLSPGIGGSCLGTKAVLTVNDPYSNFFMVGVQMVRGSDGEIHPAVTEIQMMPLQLDKTFQYQDRFLEEHEQPEREMRLKLQQVISNDLLHGDIAYTLVTAFAVVFEGRGASKLLGIKGEQSRWLVYHDHAGGKQRCKKAYDEKFRDLGWKENGRYWEFELSNIPEAIQRALKFRLISHDGLCMVVEAIRDMFPHLVPEISSSKECADLLCIFRDERERRRRLLLDVH